MATTMLAPATKQAHIDELLALIASRQRFFVTSHARPDGDAIGSALGMMHLLEGLGKEVCVAFADPIPAIYQSLPGADRITASLPSTHFDAAIIMECSSIDRTGYARIDSEVNPTPFVINIDHHLSGKTYADYNWIDPSECAVGAMVYDVAVAAGVDITPAMATCLYTAVLTDTGSFNYSSTTASTFALAEHLVERGADPQRIAQQVFSANPLSKMRLLGTALSRLEVDGGLAWSWVMLSDMAAAGAGNEDTEGVVNQLLGIAGVEAAVLLREQKGGQFRLSLRSKDAVDVAKVAESFSGGGHRNASGCTIDGPLDTALLAVLTGMRAQL